jgi:hypothetical protein
MCCRAATQGAGSLPAPGPVVDCSIIGQYRRFRHRTISSLSHSLHLPFPFVTNIKAAIICHQLIINTHTHTHTHTPTELYSLVAIFCSYLQPPALTFTTKYTIVHKRKPYRKEVFIHLYVHYLKHYTYN